VRTAEPPWRALQSPELSAPWQRCLWEGGKVRPSRLHGQVGWGSREGCSDNLQGAHRRSSQL
jgi:hypothetical protein